MIALFGKRHSIQLTVSNFHFLEKIAPPTHANQLFRRYKNRGAPMIIKVQGNCFFVIYLSPLYHKTLQTLKILKPRKNPRLLSIKRRYHGCELLLTVFYGNDSVDLRLDHRLILIRFHSRAIFIDRWRNPRNTGRQLRDRFHLPDLRVKRRSIRWTQRT